MEIGKVLILSTSHLPSNEEFERIESNTSLPYRYLNHEYGAVLILQERNESTEESFKLLNELHPRLSGIIEYALKYNMRYIDFDRDVETSDCFKSFDW